MHALKLNLGEVENPLDSLSKTDLEFIEELSNNGGDALAAYRSVFGVDAGGMGAALSLKSQLSVQYRYLLGLMAMDKSELMVHMSMLMRQVKNPNNPDAEGISVRDYTSLASVMERLLKHETGGGDGHRRPGSLEEAYEILALVQKRPN